MNRLKICRIFFVAIIAIIFCSMPLTVVRAQSGQTPGPGISFVGSPDGINCYVGDIEQTGFSVYLYNDSDSPVTVSVLILGVDGIIQSNIDAQPLTLESGTIGDVPFTVKTGEAATEIINTRKVITGSLIFSSSAGGFIYKTITITTELSPSEIKAPEASEIVLLNESDGTITIDWDALENGTMVFPILNTSQYSANIEALLYFPDLTSNQPPVIQPIWLSTLLSLPIEPFKASNIRFKLNDPPSEPKKYDGLLILTDSGGAWSILKKVELYVPSAGQQPVHGTGLEFLADDKTPISLDYNRLKRGEPVEIGLVNKGKDTITITSAQVIVTDLIDRKGNKIELQSSGFQSLTIPSLETGFINLRIIDGNAPAASPAADITLQITGTPQSGTYSGYLVLATDSDQPVLVMPVSLEVSTISSTLPTVIDKCAAGVQIFFQNLFHRQFRFGVAEWSIFAILAALVIYFFLWAWQKVRIGFWNASGNLGPVYLDEILDKPELRASLRHHLSHCGILPKTAVPNVSIGATEFTTVVTKSKIPEAAFIEAILLFLQKTLGKKPGYVVGVIVSKDTPKTIINVQIRLMHNNRVKCIETLEGDNPEEAIKKAAFYVYYHLTSQKAALARIPRWSRFPSLGSFQQYKRAEELKGEGKYTEAIEQYKCASKGAPFNALLRQGWGDACELNGQILDALDVYLEAVSMWPYLYSFWYRIATNFSYVVEWWDESTKEDRNRISQLYNCTAPVTDGDFWGELHQQRKPKQTEMEIKDPSEMDFLKQSRYIYRLLDKEIKWGRAISNWRYALGTGIWNSIFKQTEYITGLTRYLWHYIPFLPWKGAIQFQRMTKLASYTELMHRPRNLRENGVLEQDISKDRLEAFILRKTGALVNEKHNRPEVYYNAACVYARLISKTEGKAKDKTENKIEDKSPFVVLDENIREEILADEALLEKKDQKKKTAEDANHKMDEALKEVDPKVRILQDVNPKTEALKYIRKAHRGHPPLDAEWTKTDPDLKELHKDPEFKALFDVPKKEEKQNEENKEKKNKHDMISLLRKGIARQRRYWKEADSEKTTAAWLVAETDYQVRMWKSLEDLSAKPTDGDLQEAFWKLVTQKGKTGIMHKPFEMSQSNINNLDMDKLDKCLKFVQSASKSQREVWEKRKEDSKLFLKHIEAPMASVWALWRQAEIAQWSYLEKKVCPILKDKPSKKKSDKSPKRPARRGKTQQATKPRQVGRSTP